MIVPRVRSTGKYLYVDRCLSCPRNAPKGSRPHTEKTCKVCGRKWFWGPFRWLLQDKESGDGKA